jgi:hypothetical protein
VQVEVFIRLSARFDWADQVWAFVGFDTVLNLSGDDNPQQCFAISRHVLTWMASLVAGHQPTSGLTCIAAEERGIGLWWAIIHTAHKLNRTCFRLLLADRPYQDDTHPDDFARWHSYWLAYCQRRANPKLHPHPGPWHSTR